MSPRPRKATDEQVFAAASRVMSRLAPAQLTLAKIAAEAGVTPGALVQRFGSKRGLLRALGKLAATGTEAMFRGLRAAHRSPLAALRAYARCYAQLGDSPTTLANNLGYLQLDLTDPEMRRHLLAQGAISRRAIRQLLEEAVAAGELRRDVDAAALTRQVEVTLGGSLLVGAVYSQATGPDAMVQDLDAALRPYLRRRR